MSDSDSGPTSDDERRLQAQQEKRQMQMKYLEQENENLQIENGDLQETLRINKTIIG